MTINHLAVCGLLVIEGLTLVSPSLGESSMTESLDRATLLPSQTPHPTDIDEERLVYAGPPAEVGLGVSLVSGVMPSTG